MEQITDLRELLKHELKDLYSAETQIIDGLPRMIETARNPQLKKALSDHLKVTRDQKIRLDKIEAALNYKNDKKKTNNGFFFNLFKSSEGEQHCKAMEGLIKEAQSLMEENMAPEVMDAAIIAAAQKIEHYEIGSYGTARAYAEQLGMKEVEILLKKTLDEEYFADDSLTKIALNKVNIKAENAGTANSNAISKSNRSGGNGKVAANRGSSKGISNKSGSNSTQKKPAPARSSSGTAVKKSVPKKAPTNKPATKKSSNNSNSGKRPVTKKAAPKKTAPNKKAPKKTSAGSGNARTAFKKASPKKSPTKKTAFKKSAPKKTVSKSASKKVARRK